MDDSSDDNGGIHERTQGGQVDILDLIYMYIGIRSSFVQEGGRAPQ